MGFVVECLLEYNPTPVKEPLCKTKHSCVKRSTSSYWKGDGLEENHSHPAACLFLLFCPSLFFFTPLRRNQCLLFPCPRPPEFHGISPPVDASEIEIPFLPRQPKKEAHSAHFVFLPGALGQLVAERPPSVSRIFAGSGSSASLSLSMCSP